MKFLEVLVVINLCAIGSVHGQLNGSLVELAGHFGAPVSEATGQAFGSRECVFQYKGWEVHAYLLDGRCEQVTYIKKGTSGEPASTAVFKTARWKALEASLLGAR